MKVRDAKAYRVLQSWNVCKHHERSVKCGTIGFLHVLNVYMSSYELVEANDMRLHFANVFQKYHEFGAPVAALCACVRRTRRIRSSSGCTLHTCSGTITNSQPECAYFTKCSRNGIDLNSVCRKTKTFEKTSEAAQIDHVPKRLRSTMYLIQLQHFSCPPIVAS